MTIKIRMRGKSVNGVAEIKALISHPMESGVRMNQKTGKPFPAEFIDTVEVLVNDVKAIDSQWSGAVSTNPYVAIQVKANAGDNITIKLSDNNGASGTDTIALK